MRLMTLVFMICIMTSLAAAYFPGETVWLTNELNSTNLDYIIIGNSTIAPALNMGITDANISITFPGNMTPDNFDIIFIEREVEIETVIETVTNTVTEEVEVEVEVIKYLEKEVIVEKEVVTIQYTDEYLENAFAELADITNGTEEIKDEIIIPNVITNETIEEVDDRRFLKIFGMVFIGIMIIVVVYLFFKKP